MQRFRWLIGLVLAILSGVRCSETPSSPGNLPETPPENTIPALIVSEAFTPARPEAVASAGSTIAVAYVSLPSGSVSNTVSVRIRNLTTGGGATTSVPIVDGGFDPVAVPASAGDRLELSFTDKSGRVSEEYATVPLKRPPVVVRTAPMKGRTDVALLVRPVVVFSEPIDPATLPVGMRLVTGGTLVSGRIELLEPWVAEFVPTSPLEPGTTYVLEITREIRGVDGVALEGTVTAEFTTEPSAVATGGVIGILVEASGTDVDGVFGAMVDGGGAFFVGPGGPFYLTGVPAGDHVVSLVGPANCSAETDQQPVTLTVGLRDTVEVTFSVTCQPRVGVVRITAPTTGSLPSSTRYRVWYEHFGYWDYGGDWTDLGDLDPGAALVAEVRASSETGADPYWYFFQLGDIPANCSVHGDPHPYPLPGFAITFGDTLDIEFPVACLP